MTPDTTQNFLSTGLGLVLFLWVIGSMTLVILLRRQLKTVTAQRDEYAAQLDGFISVVGQPATVIAGEYAGETGAVIWILKNEVCLQTEADQITLNLSDVQFSGGVLPPTENPLD